MSKKDLLFYDEYEQFYSMAGKSKVFKKFCEKAFGKDFSQDGFSDINQVNMILPYIVKKENAKVLDIGCGNGKMLRYLQSETGCSIYGFDYSINAINEANSYNSKNSEFKEGVIGEIDYPEEYFDVIVSMDTMYFAKDMSSFIGQVKRWLKNDGVLFVAYQEGDVIQRTENEHTTLLAKAFKDNGIEYSVTNITKQTYDMLIKKRTTAEDFKEDFVNEGSKDWYDMLMWQTECVVNGYEAFSVEMARYIYVARVF